MNLGIGRRDSLVRANSRIERSIKEMESAKLASSTTPRGSKGVREGDSCVAREVETLADASGPELRCRPVSRLGEERQMYLSQRAPSSNFGGNNYVTTSFARRFDNQNSTPRSLPPSRSP
ncbi:hypothetical protein LTR10_002501 [Elasticomyces elasticus]|nr:hypothetical protein LTR10_002501 [Elasticomyces elasticus]KAK4973439.1 hypothetical protein LTR42_005425 [Elasticomyces elasticus]